MSKIVGCFIGILCCAAAEAQSNQGFISPDMAYSTELFPKKEKNVAFLSSMPESTSSIPEGGTPTISALPKEYDLAKDIRREQRIKRAAVVQYTSDPLGRSPLPDAGREANEQMQMRNITTR